MFHKHEISPEKKIAIEEARSVVRQFRFLTLLVIIVVLSGSTFYHIVEDWRWLDAVYFSVISLATVGYGDITPQTDAGKIFTMFYLIIGIGIFAALLNNLLKSRFAKRSLRIHEASEIEDEHKS